MTYSFRLLPTEQAPTKCQAVGFHKALRIVRWWETETVFVSEDGMSQVPVGEAKLNATRHQQLRELQENQRREAMMTFCII